MNRLCTRNMQSSTKNRIADWSIDFCWIHKTLQPDWIHIFSPFTKCDDKYAQASFSIWNLAYFKTYVNWSKFDGPHFLVDVLLKIHQSKINSRLVAGPIGQTNHRPSVLCSKYYFFKTFYRLRALKTLYFYFCIFFEK